jgi:hypothetical protein
VFGNFILSLQIDGNDDEHGLFVVGQFDPALSGFLFLYAERTKCYF